jgi:hypothetical protein
MILGMHWDGLWTLPFGLSQFHGHSSWLVCEVALSWTIGFTRDSYLRSASERDAENFYHDTYYYNMAK